MSAVTVLRGAAQLLRTGQVAWGRGYFFDQVAGCRCALGAIAIAADPRDEDGDPRSVAQQARADAIAAVDLLVGFLVHEFDAVPALHLEEIEGDEVRVVDPIETVGGWNDEPERTVDDVVRALEAAADHVERTASAA